MIRADMISVVGREYLTSNIENDEYSYPKAFSVASLPFVPITNTNGRKFEKIDIRFVKDGITVLVETKQNFTKADEEQLSAYVEYEKALTGNKTIAILANTTNDNVRFGVVLFLMAILCKKKPRFAQWTNTSIFTLLKSMTKKK